MCGACVERCVWRGGGGGVLVTYNSFNLYALLRAVMSDKSRQINQILKGIFGKLLSDTHLVEAAAFSALTALWHREIAALADLHLGGKIRTHFKNIAAEAAIQAAYNTQEMGERSKPGKNARANLFIVLLVASAFEDRTILIIAARHDHSGLLLLLLL